MISELIPLDTLIPKKISFRVGNYQFRQLKASDYDQALPLIAETFSMDPLTAAFSFKATVWQEHCYRSSLQLWDNWFMDPENLKLSTAVVDCHDRKRVVGLVLTQDASKLHIKGPQSQYSAQLIEALEGLHTSLKESASPRHQRILQEKGTVGFTWGVALPKSLNKAGVAQYALRHNQALLLSNGYYRSYSITCDQGVVRAAERDTNTELVASINASKLEVKGKRPFAIMTPRNSQVTMLMRCLQSKTQELVPRL